MKREGQYESLIKEKLKKNKLCLNKIGRGSGFKIYKIWKSRPVHYKGAFPALINPSEPYSGLRLCRAFHNQQPKSESGLRLCSAFHNQQPKSESGLRLCAVMYGPYLNHNQVCLNMG